MDGQPDPDIRIAGYRIEALVGRGGMGEVYRAVQLNLGRRVALKILAPELAADDRFRRRFLRESRIAAGIDHPNIIPIYETGEDGGLLYIAMRYVDGPDLATLLGREGRLEPARAKAIMAQVAGALDAAHAHGLVHRDVKPANILLAAGPGGTRDHCYLCDFGLIKQMDSEEVASALTATDQFVGSIPYVAPEQIEGGAVDGRADVYSLGCVLFECLTGSVPFEGANDVEMVFAHLGRPPPPVSERAPGLPPALDAVLGRALAKSKEDRWPTCSALVAAMEAELRSGPGRPVAAGGDDATRSMVLPPLAVVPPVVPPAAGRPVDARSASGPPVGERTGPGEEVPAAVHRGGAAPPATRTGRRRWRVVAAAVLLPVAAYFGAVELLSRAREPRVEAAPVTAPAPPTTRTATCRWTQPAVGTPTRTAPLDAIRAHMGWSDRFVVEEMRAWTGSDGRRRWYVKAHQETDPSRRGRWLVWQAEDGQRLVLAAAPYTSRGYAAGDWRVVAGRRAGLTGVAGCLAGT